MKPTHPVSGHFGHPRFATNRFDALARPISQMMAEEKVLGLAPVDELGQERP
jgi:hypothetical protein